MMMTTSSRNDFAQKFSQRRVETWAGVQKGIFILIEDFPL
jgi:hypothetical protein